MPCDGPGSSVARAKFPPGEPARFDARTDQPRGHEPCALIPRHQVTLVTRSLGESTDLANRSLGTSITMFSRFRASPSTLVPRQVDPSIPRQLDPPVSIDHETSFPRNLDTQRPSELETLESAQTRSLETLIPRNTGALIPCDVDPSKPKGPQEALDRRRNPPRRPARHRARLSRFAPGEQGALTGPNDPAKAGNGRPASESGHKHPAGESHQAASPASFADRPANQPRLWKRLSRPERIETRK